MVGTDVAVSQVAKPRKGPYWNLEGFENLHHVTDHRGLDGWDCDHNLVGFLRGDDTGQIFSPAENLNTMNSAADFFLIIIDKSDRLVTIKGTIVPYVTNDHFPRVSRAVNQEPSTFLT